MFGRQREDAQPPAQVYVPLPPGTVRDPEAVEVETPPTGECDGEREYW